MLKLTKSHTAFLLLAGLVVGLAIPTLVADAQNRGNVYRVNRQSQWEQWRFPSGTLDIARNGSITPRQFRQRHNAALKAGDFLHELQSGQEVWGGVWKAGSNERNANAIIDGDPDTFWQPDPDAPLEDWWIEIDLGRATLVTEIRLIFPDQEGARPLSEFRVFGSDGHRVTRNDVFSFHLIGGTTKPINETEVVYNVEPIVREVTRARGTSDAAPSSQEETPSNDATYDMLQYIRILADSKTPNAALAEVEVYTPGENIALETLTRNGTIQERLGRGFASHMADGDANTDWGARRERNQEAIAWEWDLGALFFLDRIVMRTSDFLVRTLTYGSNLPEIRTHQLSTSDGSRTLTGAVDYDVLFDGNPETFLAAASEFPGQLSYAFPPRPVRFISADWIGNTTGNFSSQSGFLVETFIYPVGYMAQVEMVSDFIDLGALAGDDRAKVIRNLEWEADLPPGTQVLARTRTGNTLQENTRYFRKDGTEVTAQQYEDMFAGLRGDTETTIGIGKDWSSWSNLYQVSGELFRSPSPRRYVQVMLILDSDLPTAAPTLRSLAINFNNTLLTGIEGEILPRTAQPGESQAFTYRIEPLFRARDTGFDRLLVLTPSLVEESSFALRIDGEVVEAEAVSIGIDSLLVDLPQRVRSDEVELDFNLTIKDNATVFQAFVGRSQEPGIWQPIDPSDRAATTVFLPAVPGRDQLITNIAVRPFLTPNGDGVGDVAEISFHVLKVDFPAQVQIYRLDGGLVRELEGQSQSDRSYLYTWAGKDQNGSLVPPGIYLCHISVDAQTGKEAQQRIISVAY